jgi:hypothetical protein
MRRARLLLPLLVLAFVATGCFRQDLGVTVNDDGSGSVSMLVAFNPEAMSQFTDELGEAAGEMPEDPCADIESSASEDASGLPDGASVEPYREGDFCGVILTAGFESVDELDETLGTLFSNTESQGLASFQSFTIEQDGDGWVFEAVPLDTGSETGGMDTGMFEDMLDGASNVVRVKLPGRQVDHNADRIDGDGTLIWNLDVLGDTRTLQARTEPGDPITDEVLTDAGEDVGGEIGSADGAGGDDDGGSSVVWIVLGVLVVAAAVVGFVLWQRNKSKATPAMAGGPVATGPPLQPTDAASAGASPTGPTTAASAPASDGPQWDAQRNAYIQWDAAGGRWLQYDDTTKEWTPIS